VHFDRARERVVGVDNNMRSELLRARGRHALEPRAACARECRRFTHHDLDVRDRAGLQSGSSVPKARSTS
jgi:hypothetical protein